MKIAQEVNTALLIENFKKEKIKPLLGKRREKLWVYSSVTTFVVFPLLGWLYIEPENYFSMGMIFVISALLSALIACGIMRMFFYPHEIEKKIRDLIEEDVTLKNLVENDRTFELEKTLFDFV